jgi:dolichol-phosphate mannosyltransferase
VWDLTVVMPAYNEEACVASVVDEWIGVLGDLGIDFRMMVLDDGSTDGTGRALRRFSEDPRVEVVAKANSGHGATILLGYRRAVSDSAWVFQCDADGEMGAASFGEIWKLRDDYDALLGTRLDRKQSAARGAISAVSRVVVNHAYGRGVEDVNTPYRLMRADVLAPILSRIPDDTFAPNVVIAGALAANGAVIANIPVPHAQRTTGKVSIVRWGLVRAAARSLVQTVWLAPRLRDVALPSSSPHAKGGV